MSAPKQSDGPKQIHELVHRCQTSDVDNRAATFVLSLGLKQLGARRRMRRYIRVLAIVCDVLSIAAAYMIANVIRFGNPLDVQGLNMMAVILPTFLAIAANSKAFSIASIARVNAGGSVAALAFLISLSAVGLVVFFLKVSTDFSRLVFGLGAAFAVIFIPLARWALASLSLRILGDWTLCEVVLNDGLPVESELRSVILDAAELGLSPRLDDPVMLDRLGRYLVNADRVVVACVPDRRSLWAAALKGAGINAEVLAEDLDELGAIGLSKYAGRSTLVVATGPLGAVDRALKRMLDLALTLLALVPAVPVMILVAVAVRIESHGPILFAQQRVGFGNRLFKVYKFRSMYEGSADGEGRISTRRNDARITKVGRIIRATSLDELPQLFNVLSGAMSIVGPRPHALASMAEEKYFWDIDLAYWQRHAVKPGMTGLAQVRGYRGATEKATDLRNRLQADLEYVAGWTIWRDIRIIFATFRVLVHRNAF